MNQHDRRPSNRNEIRELLLASLLLGLLLISLI